jgi:hypothetical protein
VTVSDTLNIGDATTRTVTFKNVAGDPTDPTTTTATLYLPDGTSSSPAITNGTTGVRSVTITPTMSGTHRLKWAGTGAVAEVEWDVFTVDPDPTVGDTDIITLGEAKTELNITTNDTDPVLERWITAVSGLIDSLCGPVVIRTVTDEAHNGGGTILFLRQHPVSEITTVTEYASGTATVLTAESPTVAGTYLFNPTLGTVSRRSSWNNYPFGASGVLVTYEAGRYADTASVDARFKTAALAILRRFWARETPSWVRGTGGFADLVQNPAVEPGTPGFFRAVQPVVNELLGDQLLGPAVA